MLEDGKIGVRQFTVLVTIFTIGSSILVAPAGLASEAKQDAWIAAILGVGVSMVFVWLYNTLGTRFPDMTLAEYSEHILGKWAGKIVSLLFVSYFFILAALLLREIGDFMTTQIMPETPIQSIHIIFIGVVLMGTRLGLEPLTRASEIFFPWIIGLLFFLVMALTTEIDFQRMEPILGEGIKPIMRGAFPFLGLPFLELVVFLMIFPYVNKTKEAAKALFVGTLIGGIVIIVITMLTIIVLGSDLAARQIYPSFVLSKKVNIANFLQRVENIMAGIWFLTIYFKLTICFYASALGLAQTLKLRDYRVVTFPLGMILVVLSLVASPNIVYFLTFVKEIWTPYSLTYGLLLPLILLGVAAIRKI
ncbi:spore germination protein [Paenibacillus alkaliterrae]|uniref:GerAB/ArcD/ProY family transporter n=1 Tax=Paenibacillus alkaliterrae TaxID=320909 RepID=UPI001F3D25F9|nr:endospore germination permease [Paenibacillus alkaliterrae]MCF2939799.1 spore germination protein [Paenibacillus alkaliterrae]